MAFGYRTGRVAALMLAMYPNHVFYTTLHLTEPLFAFLLTAAFVLLLKSEERAYGMDMMAGAVIGLAALVRPVAVMLPVALPVWYWSQCLPIRTILTRTALVGVATLSVLSPWLMRNHGITGQSFLISTTGGHNFWMGNYPGAFGGYAYPKEINEQLRVGSGYDYSRGYQLGLTAIAHSPGRAILRSVQKVTYFLALETDGALWNLKGFKQPPPGAISLFLLSVANGAYLLVVALAVLALMKTRSAHPASSLFLVVSVYLVLVAAVFVGDPRYHHALIPMALIFTAKAAVEDAPALMRELQLRRAVARKELLKWGSLIVTLFLLMAVNVVIKEIEFRTLARYAPTRLKVFGL